MPSRWVADDRGLIDQIHILTGSALGLGERIVTAPQPAFMIKGEMVLISDLSSEDIGPLPGDPSVSHLCGPRIDKFYLSHRPAGSIARSMSNFSSTERCFSGTGNKSSPSAAPIAEMPVSSICRPDGVMRTA